MNLIKKLYRIFHIHKDIKIKIYSTNIELINIHEFTCGKCNEVIKRLYRYKIEERNIIKDELIDRCD